MLEIPRAFFTSLTRIILSKVGIFLKIGIPKSELYVTMDKQKIARAIHDYLRSNNLTQEEFARIISAPLSSVSNWIHGKTKMSKVWQKVLKEKGILVEEIKCEKISYE